MKTDLVRASYDIPFKAEAGGGRCPAAELCIGALEFAYGHAPAPEQPHFERSDWRYVPNPARLVDCGDSGDCGVNIVFDVWKAAADDDRNSVLALQVYIVPQEYLHYREYLARAAADGEPRRICSDLDAEFARRAACNPVTGLQDEQLLTDKMCLIFRSGRFEIDDLPQRWGRITGSEIVALRTVDRAGRVFVPLRIDVSSLEPGNYGLVVQVFDRLAEQRKGREVSALSGRPVWFQVVGER